MSNYNDNLKYAAAMMPSMQTEAVKFGMTIAIREGKEKPKLVLIDVIRNGKVINTAFDGPGQIFGFFAGFKAAEDIRSQEVST